MTTKSIRSTTKVDLFSYYQILKLVQTATISEVERTKLIEKLIMLKTGKTFYDYLTTRIVELSFTYRSADGYECFRPITTKQVFNDLINLLNLPSNFKFSMAHQILIAEMIQLSIYNQNELLYED